MLKTVFIVFIMLLNTYVRAWSASDFPETFSVEQGNCEKYDRCVSILSRDRLIGSLRAAPNKLHTFYFFDQNQQLKLLLKKQDIHIEGPPGENIVVVNFDVFNNNLLIAKIKLMHAAEAFSYQAFFIKTADDDLLVRGERYLSKLGTHTIIYGDLNSEMAILTRPLFTFNLDSKVQIQHKEALLSLINPNVFLSALALYSNTALFYTELKQSDNALSKEMKAELREKLGPILLDRETSFSDLRGNVMHITDEESSTAKKILSKRYIAVYGEDFWDVDTRLTIEVKTRQFVDLGVDMLLAHILEARQELALLKLFSELL